MNAPHLSGITAEIRLEVLPCFGQLKHKHLYGFNGLGCDEKDQCKTADFLNVNQIIEKTSFQGN